MTFTLLAATLVVGGLLLSSDSGKTGAPVQEAAKLPPTESGPGEREQVPSAYARWFYGQRAYPAKQTPPRALQRAAVQARRLQLGATREEAASAPSVDWTSIGPKPIMSNWGDGAPFWAGRVTALAPVGDGTTVYLGAAQGGVWETTDAGVHWTPVFDNAIAAGGTGLAIGSLAVDPADSSTVYAGTGEANFSDSYFGGGIFKSTNGGGSWSKLGGSLLDTCHVADLEIRAGTILAAAVRVGRWTRTCVGGVYRSSDGGASWNRTLADDSDTYPPGSGGMKTTGAFDVAPGVSGTWFASIYGDDPAHAGGNIFKSTNDGASWQRLAGGLPTTLNGRTELATAPSDRNRIYAVMSASGNPFGALLGIYTSADGGASWTKLPDPGDFCGNPFTPGAGVCHNRLGIGVDPANPGVVYAGSIETWKSSNYGQTWTQQTAINTYFDLDAIEFDSVGRLWIGNDGGVWRSANGGASWDDLNSTLAIAQFEWGIAGEADADGPIFSGTQDHGTDRRKPDGSWDKVAGGDGGAAVWRASEPAVAYGSIYFDYLIKSTNGGTTFQDANADLKAKEDPNEFFNFHPPLVADPANGQKLYFASTRVWRTADGATTWNPISPHFGPDPSFMVQALGVTTSPDVLYAGTNNGRLELTTNATAGSPTWTETQANGLPNRTFTEIETKPGSPGTAYVTASGFDPDGGSGHIFTTTDFGAHWTDVSSNLPNAPVNAIEIDWRTSPATLYAATDVGVFWSQNGGLNWNNTSVGLPPLMVVDVKLDTTADKLIAATHGRGMYVAPILPARTTRTLALTKGGDGAGAVTSTPAGIDCGSTCLYDFDPGTSVALTAMPAAGSTFSGWSGDCSGTGTCQLTMSTDHSATAVFTLAPKTLGVQKAGAGSGTVTSNPAGIDCGSSCSHDFAPSTSVTLTATAATGSTFTGWSGACSGNGSCTLTMSENRSATATFALIPFSLAVDKVGSGGGAIVSSPAGIDCGSTCSHDFDYGTSVTLTATASSGSNFSGWSGACSGSGTCTLTMDQNRAATATFSNNPPPEKCVVPNVEGKTLAAAESAIKRGKCSVGSVKKAYSHKKKGTVTSQKPGPGTKLAKGGKVNLVVSKGKKPS
jgi:hypothetical protein